MDLFLDDTQQAIVENVRRFVRDEISPLERDLDPDAAELPAEEYERLVGLTQQMGLFNLELPEEFGGPGLPTVTRCLVAIEASQHAAGLYAPCYDTFGHPGQIPLLSEFANEDQRERYLYPSVRGEKRACFALTEPSGGSDPGRSIQTRAVPDGDNWLISGSKTFISDAINAQFGIVFARTGPPDSGREGITAFIVDLDSPGVVINGVIRTLRVAHPPSEIFFDSVSVPKENVFGGIGQGFKLANARLAKNRIAYSAACIGLAVKAQEMAVEYAKVRQAFGKKLIDQQGINWMLVDSEHDIRTATLMVMLAADRADKDRPFRTEAASAKIIATEAAARVVDRAIQIHGGIGVTKELPLERWYRELRIRRIGEGATEVQRMLVGRELKHNDYRFFLR